MNPTVLYFVPGNEQACSKGLLERAGLDHLIGTKNPSVHTLNSPANKPGCIFQAVAQNAECDDAKTRYDKDAQTWHACDGGKWWIGWWTDDPPTPECFLRELNFLHQQRFLPILADNNTWVVLPSLGLPRGFGLRDGSMCEVEQEKYRHIYEASARLFEWRINIEPREFEEVLSDIAICLSANYTLTKWEVLALELITKENIQNVVDCCLDINDDLEYGQKKTDSEEPAQNSG
jgi:hypothetical protein